MSLKSEERRTRLTARLADPAQLRRLVRFLQASIVGPEEEQLLERVGDNLLIGEPYGGKRDKLVEIAPINPGMSPLCVISLEGSGAERWYGWEEEDVGEVRLFPRCDAEHGHFLVARRGEGLWTLRYTGREVRPHTVLLKARTKPVLPSPADTVWDDAAALEAFLVLADSAWTEDEQVLHDPAAFGKVFHQIATIGGPNETGLRELGLPQCCERVRSFAHHFHLYSLVDTYGADSSID